MTFQKGQSGNPAGRPVNTSDRRNKLREALQSRAPEIINKAIEMALNGDSHALRLCMDRIMPKLTGCHINIDIPTADLDKPTLLLSMGEEAIKAVAAGAITTEQAKSFTDVLEAQRKMTETVELKTILDKIQEQLNVKK